MKTEDEDNHVIIKHSDDIFLKKYTSLFQNYHKFRTNTEIEISVYQGAKGFTNQIVPFRQACESIHSTSIFRIVTLTCSDVNTFKLSELDIIDWFISKLACCSMKSRSGKQLIKTTAAMSPVVSYCMMYC